MMQVIPWKMIVNSFLLSLFVGVAFAQNQEFTDGSIEALKLKCGKNGGDAAKFEEAWATLKTCFTGQWNTDEIYKEVNEAKSVDRKLEVLKKQCEKRPVVMGCVRNFTDAAKQCLSAQELNHLKSMHSAIELMLDFCLKDDETIARVAFAQNQEFTDGSIEALKLKCGKNGGDAAKFEEAWATLNTCFTVQWNTDEIYKEVKEAKSVDRKREVLKKECEKRPVVMGCVRNFTDAAKQCLSAQERNHLKSMHSATEQMLDFACLKDGEMIALYISKNGSQCISQKFQMIAECIKNTYNISINFNYKYFVNTFPEINFEEKQCNSFNEVQSCIVEALKTCEEPTPANIINSLFNAARKSLPCKEGANSGSRVARATLTTAAVAIFINILL